MRSSLDKISTQILRFVPFIVAFIVPLFFLPFTSDYFTFNKFYLLSFLASVSLVAWCVRNLVRGKLIFTASPSFIPFILLVIANIISSVWLSPIKYMSLFGQTSLFISLAIIFITTTSSQKNKILVDSVVYGLIGSACILSILTILHHFGLLQQLVENDITGNKMFNLTGGVLPALSFILPIAIATIGMSAVSKNWLTKSALFGSVMIMIVSSVINISLLFPQDKQPVLAILPYRASWSIAIDTLKSWQTAALGTGPETYATTFTRLRPSYLNLDKNIWNIRFAESGSFLLTLVTTTGLIGGFSYLLLFVRPLLLAVKHKKQIIDEPTTVFLILSVFAAFLSTIILPAGVTTLSLAVVSLIALTVAYKLHGTNGVKDVSFSLSQTSNSHEYYSAIESDSEISLVKTFLPWVTTVISLTLIALYWFFAVATYKAAITIKEAADIVKTNSVGSFMKQVNAINIDRYNPSYQTIVSQTYQGVAKYYLSKEDKKNAIDAMQRAVDAGRQAALLDPNNVSSYENLANIYQSFIGNADGAADYAVSHLAQAVALDPTSPRLRLQLGILFFNLGDADQAIKLIGQAIELKQDWDVPYYNMAAIYKNKKDYSRSLQYMKAGFALTDPKSSDYGKIQEEISSIEKLIPSSPNTATSSGVTR